MWEIDWDNLLTSMSYDWWRYAVQPWYGVIERYKHVFNTRGAPRDRLANEYWAGHVVSVVDNGDGTCDVECLNDDGTDPAWYYDAGIPKKRWVGWDNTDAHGPPWAARDYDLVIDDVAYDPGAPCHDPDPRKVIQSNVTDQYSTHKLKISLNAPLKIDERVITTLGDLAGRPAYIVKRGGDIWTRMLPDWPNSQNNAAGVVLSAAAGTLTAALLRRRPGITSMVGMDVLYVAGGRMRRGRITTHPSSGSTITYTGTAAAAVVGQLFYVVPADAFFQWGRKGGRLQAAYGGLVDEGWYAHHPSDEAVPTGKPAQHTPPFRYSQDPLTCPALASTQLLFDLDVRNPYDNMCEVGDYPFSPNLNKTYRAVWLNLFDMTRFFIDKDLNLDGAGAVLGNLPKLRVASVFRKIGENYYLGTTGTHTGGSMPLAAGVPYTDIPLWWEIVDADNVLLADGFEQHYDGVQVSGSFTADMDGQTFVATTGPTQLLPRQVRLLNDVPYFMPAITGTPAAAVVPPTDTDPGVYQKRLKSTDCLSPDDGLFVQEGVHARDAVAPNMRARYVGDRFRDPGFPVLLIKPTGGAPDPDPAARYYNHATISRRASDTYHRIQRSLRGTATGGSNVRLVDATRTSDVTKAWTSVDFYFNNNYNGRTHTGVGGAGSNTTTLVDASKAGTGMWAAVRFAGYASPFQGFVVRFLISGSSFADPAAVIEWRQVSTGNGVTGTLTWAEPLPVSALGLTYELPEPYVPNHLVAKGAKVRLVRRVAGVITHNVLRPLLGHSTDTLFFADAGFTVDANTSYEIDMPRLGDVMKREADGSWTSTGGAGADPRVTGAVFRRDGRLNCEDHDTRYGLPRPMYHTMQFKVGHRQLHKYIDQLTRTEGGPNTLVKACSVASGDLVPVDWNHKGANWHPIGTTPGGEAATFDDVYDKLTNGNYPTEVIPTFWSNAENDAPGAPPNDLPPGDRSCDHAFPRAVFQGGSFWQWLPPGGGGSPVWTANYMGPAYAERQRDQMMVQFATKISKDVQFLVRTIRPGVTDSSDYDSTAPGSGSEYDANGDPVAERAWRRYSTGSGTDGPIVSAVLGGTAIPNRSAVPVPTGSGSSLGATARTTRVRGWVTTHLTTVADFDFKYRQGGCGGAPLSSFEWTELSED